MGTQPPGTGPRWGAQWRDDGMAAAYDARHDHPEELFAFVAGLRRAEHAGLPVLDIGAGNGRVTAGLVRHGLTPIDAVEPSTAMADRAPALDGVSWIIATFEDAPLSGPYGLAVAGESIHWTDWPVSFPKAASLLAEGAVLAIVGQQEGAAGRSTPGSQPWLADVQPLIEEFATSKEYVSYNLPDALRAGGYWEELGSHRTAWEPRTCTIDEHIRAFHSRNGLSPDAMGDTMAAFDGGLRAVLEPHARADGLLHTEVAGVIHWGRPNP
jgi:SAM-dependent methyltransferase